MISVRARSYSFLDGHRLKGGGRGAPGTARCFAEACGGRQRTLRKALEYLPQSTRILCGEYDSALRRGFARLPADGASFSSPLRTK